jgi:hypothetical protein
MDRPEKGNSMIPPFWRELPEIVNDLSASGSVRSIGMSNVTSVRQWISLSSHLAVIGGPHPLFPD